ncbi:hypothetical protein CG51_17490 [Haematobacter missouriensis]|nr:hypothetical protein CG51_17490 [Haematobacter missouriensis]
MPGGWQPPQRCHGAGPHRAAPCVPVGTLRGERSMQSSGSADICRRPPRASASAPANRKRR